MPKCRNTMVALAIEASGLANQKEALAFEVVKHILGKEVFFCQEKNFFVLGFRYVYSTT